MNSQVFDSTSITKHGILLLFFFVGSLEYFGRQKFALVYFREWYSVCSGFCSASNEMNNLFQSLGFAYFLKEYASLFFSLSFSPEKYPLAAVCQYVSDNKRNWICT